MDIGDWGTVILKQARFRVRWLTHSRSASTRGTRRWKQLCARAGSRRSPTTTARGFRASM